MHAAVHPVIADHRPPGGELDGGTAVELGGEKKRFTDAAKLGQNNMPPHFWK
jgi:hypothetical protein